MKKNIGLRKICYLLAIMFLLAGVFPFTVFIGVTTAYADDGTEPVPAEEPAATPPVGEAEAVDNGSEEPEVEEPPDENLSLEEVLGTEVTAEPTLEEFPVAEVVEETGEEVVVAEVIASAAEKEVVLADESGEALDMASTETAETLKDVVDPWYEEGGKIIAYCLDEGSGCSCISTTTTKVVECHQVGNPITDAIDNAPSGTTVYVKPDVRFETMTVDVHNDVILTGVHGDNAEDTVADIVTIGIVNLYVDITNWDNVYATIVNVMNNSAKIQDGIDIAADNGTVNVGPGTYTENLTVNKPVNVTGDVGDPFLNGPGGNAPVLNSSLYGSGTGFALGSDNITIQGFMLYGFQYGVDVNGKNIININNNAFYGMPTSGEAIIDAGASINDSYNIKFYKDPDGNGYQNECTVENPNCNKVEGEGLGNVNVVGEGKTFPFNADVVIIKAGTEELFFTPDNSNCADCSEANGAYCVRWNGDETITIFRCLEGRFDKDISNIQFWGGGPECGDGHVDPGEECDDGNDIDDDECSNDCKLPPDPECGDGHVDPGEECDDGNDIDDDGCSNDCKLPPDPECGDGHVDPGEECDDGNDIDDDECSNDCKLPPDPECGDGHVDPGEECDDGNDIDDDECSNDCKLPPDPECGDGHVDPGEECDDGNDIDDDECSNDCKLPETLLSAPLALGGASIITAGEGHTCAITPATGLRCWGWNDSGQLGDGSFEDSTIPVFVENIGGGGIIDLTAGIKHTCALFSNSTVMCWGLNDSGQLGNDSTENSNLPVVVQGLSGKIVAINAGAEFTCAETSAGEVFCWGDNSSGQLNDGTTANSLVAIKTDPEIVGRVLMVDGGGKELQGVTADGAANYWNIEPLIPVTGLPDEENEILTAGRWLEGGCSTTSEQDVSCWGAIAPGSVEGAVLDRHLLDSGSGHACTLVPGTGMVCWGSNTNGQLGVGTQEDSEDFVVVKDIESVIDLATGMNHTCAIINEDLIKCWGWNEFGQLGDASYDDAKLPVKVK